MASNATIIADPDHADNSDWIEIYNDYSYTINLNGFYLTDNLNNPDKWRFQSDINLPANSYLLVWCDGRDSALHTSFKLAQEGEQLGLFSPSLTVMDTFTYIHQTTDVSYGRLPGASSEWAYFEEPTPGAPNNTSPYSDRVENVADFSVLGGIYSTGFQVELSSYLGGTIRYTLDGSAPTGSSAAYNSPIPVNGTTIIRARVFKSGMIPGKVTTQSYFIDADLPGRNLPIVSIATDPENFWDPTVGIYVQNFKPEWEIPINIEFFENNGSDRAAFNELAGTKVNGLYSWQLPQKMLGIYFRKEYDKNSLEYPLIPDRSRTKFKSFALRASGSDWSYTMFRDGMIQTATQLNSDVDIQGFRPCIVFVNGEYLGIHNIREKVDDSYIEGNHVLEPGSFDMVENEDYAESGDLEAYNQFHQAVHQDLSNPYNYKAVEQWMDIENFTDYIIAEIYSQNTSVDHNVMAWRQKESGEWRWILMDLDRGFFRPESNLISYYVNRDVWPFSDLLENDSYKTYFGRRLADQLYTTYNPIRMHQRIQQHVQVIENEMPYHLARWQGTTSSYGNAIPSMDYWYNEIEDMHTFASERPSFLLADLVNYGFQSAVDLSLEVIPETAGYITFNGLTVPGTSWSGNYPKGTSIELQAVDKPGYDFVGWAETSQQGIISRHDTWKFLDNGTNQGTLWRNVSFNDNSWAEGPGELGYGDDDESTVIGYGGNSSNKYITTYFRKTIQLNSTQLAADGCLIYLLRDDGAVVYLNGEEIIRSNMGSGVITYQTLAASSSSGTDESEYVSYSVDPSLLQLGENVIAVEVHQISSSSSDLSFDLEMVLLTNNTTSYVSTSRDLTISLSNYRHLSAIFETNGRCILPELISADMTLSRDCSPYVVQGDVTISSSATLTIEPGVEILMAENSNIFIQGKILAQGTAEERIYFRLNSEYFGGKWGALCFLHTQEASELSYVTLMGASRGPDPVTEVAAISAFYADLKLDNMIIDQVYDNPISARYSSVSLTNSQLHSSVTGDLINVKYGSAYVANCIFHGNNQPDTDAIDYDDVENGIIRNCRIEGFLGFNSDAVDIGEKAKNILIDSLYIFNITDKGISVGQQSSASVFRSVFINCNLGLGLKDSCEVTIDQCTFYGNGIPVSCYEKNPGSAGGNAIIRNSILSNSYTRSYYADDKSNLTIELTLSDNTIPPSDNRNLFSDPKFELPDLSDFILDPTSPCLLKGESEGIPIDLGAPPFQFKKSSGLLIYSMFYNPWNDETKSEFVTLLNSGSKIIDLYGHSLARAVEYTFVDHILLPPQKKVYIVKDIQNPAGIYYDGDAFQWTTGNLANEGEIIELIHPAGIILDQVSYSPEDPWPNAMESNSEVITVVAPGLDNHFGYNWTSLPYSTVFDPVDEISVPSEISIYPNPTQGSVTIYAPNNPDEPVRVYTLTGDLLLSSYLYGGSVELDLSMLKEGIYLIRLERQAEKILITR